MEHPSPVVLAAHHTLRVGLAGHNPAADTLEVVRMPAPPVGRLGVAMLAAAERIPALALGLVVVGVAHWGTAAVRHEHQPPGERNRVDLTFCAFSLGL